MRLRRKPKKPERKDISVWLNNVNVDTVEDAKALKFQFAEQFKPGTKLAETYHWHDFSNLEDKDVHLSYEDYDGVCVYALIPEDPKDYAEKLHKYNEKLEAYNEWAKDYVDEIAAEEAKRKRRAEAMKRNQLAAINERIAELNEKARRLENEAPE
jgi:hypothetical protein